MLALARLLFIAVLVSESIEQCLIPNQTTQSIEKCLVANKTTQVCTSDTLEPISFENCLIIHINLSEGDVTLTETFNVSYIQEITIRGENTTVTCSQGSGLKFEHICAVNIKSVHFIGCGTVTSHHIGNKGKETINLHYALLIGGCQNVSILHSRITNSDGTGLVLLNNKHTDIAHSTFNENIFNALARDEISAGGGGIYLEFSCNQFTSYRNCTSSKFTIEHCNFEGNHGSAHHNKSDDGYSGVGNGGGLQLWVSSSSCNFLSVNNSNFRNNFANWGGGLQIIFTNNAQNNCVLLENSNFDSNSVHHMRGGGGLDVGYVQEGVSGNSISLNHVNITNNSGLFGGGMAIFTLDTSKQEENTILWYDCHWLRNTANYGAALNIAPQRIFNSNKELILRFTKCTFDSNTVIHQRVEKNIHRRGKGIVMITGGVSTFKESVSFLNNNSTGIYAISSTVLILKDTNVLFKNNTARNGAGISLIGFSTIVVSENTNITFCNNSVTRNGAAIYYFSIDKNAYIYARTCFIQKFDLGQSSKNVFFNFFGNTAYEDPVYDNSNRKADAIYGTSIAACSSSRENNSRYDFYDVGNFRSCNSCISSTPGVIRECEHVYTEPPVLTIEGDVSITLDSEYKDFIPGEKFNSTLKVKGVDVQTLYYVTIKNDINSNITIPNEFAVITRNILLRGKPGDTATVTFTELYFRRYSMSIRVRAMHCPPLYKISNDVCVCISNADLYFVEFHKCLNGKYQASIRLGYWISYEIENETGNDTDQYKLVNSYCPLGYGLFVVGVGYNYHKLPARFNMEELNEAICNSRKGTLCGLCKDNLTVYFHSEYFRCDTADLCYLGPLFYLVSEILPLTLLFVFIIFFNISFTSGNLNGFIFFAQIYDTISNIGGSFILPSNQFSKFSIFHRLLFKLFNIDFFDIEDLSFCLFKTTRTLDILVVKYVSIGYAFFLVIGTIWVIRCCSHFRCLQIRRSRYSIIQGLSAFLVMVYSQCTYVSLSILNKIAIYDGSKVFKTVPFMQGNIIYFSKEHLKYALPAIFCIIFFIAPLPLLLIFYPLCNKVIAFLGMQNNRAIKWTSRVIPITKIKPLLDCFQGTFKDNFRFFAGLYFLYRVTIILSRLASDVILIFMVIEIQLIAMLALHTLTLPYQNKLHNMIDLVVFADLAIINGLKLLNFFYAENGVHSENKINTIHGIQLFFIYLPLVGVIVLILCKLTKRFKGVLLRSVRLLKMTHKVKEVLVKKAERSPSRASGNRVQELDIDYDNFEDEFLDNDRSNFATESYRMVRKKKLNMAVT